MILDALFLIFILVCAVSDLAVRKVYNVAIIPALILGLGFNLMYHGLAGLGWALLGIIAGFAILLPFYLLGGMGAGDVKFLAACGALMGLTFMVWGALYGAVFGGIYAVVLLALNKRALRTLKEIVSGLFVYITTRNRTAVTFTQTAPLHVPYVVFLTAGMLLHWLEVKR